MNEIKLNEVEVQKLNMQPGEVLVVKIRSDEITQHDIEQLSYGLKKIFTNNKIIVLSVNESGSIDLTIAKESEYPQVNYCTDCSCGKKAAYEGSAPLSEEEQKEFENLTKNEEN